MSSLDFRKDARSEKVFQQNISDYTEREKFYGEALRIDIQERTGTAVEVDEHGVDNSGKLITDTLFNHNVDKKFLINGHRKLIEIKTAPEHLDSFYTFKVFSLRQALQQNALIALTKLEYFYIFGPSALNWMLDNLPHSIYPKFSPNDPAIRIFAHQVNELYHSKKLMFRKWSPMAKKFIETNRDVLARGKAF